MTFLLHLWTKKFLQYWEKQIVYMTSQDDHWIFLSYELTCISISAIARINTNMTSYLYVLQCLTYFNVLLEKKYV